MNDTAREKYASNVRSVARAFPYPPTPDIRARRPFRSPPYSSRISFLRRRTAWAAILALVAFASLLAVPQARAAVVRLIRIGAVRIFLSQPSYPSPVAPVTATTSPGQQAATASPSVTPTPLAVLDGLAGETTLEDAQARSWFQIRLPGYPSDLGLPDRVFLQDQGGMVVILTWGSPDDPRKPRLVLYELSSESWGTKKIQVEALTTAIVNGQIAAWATGPYILIYRNGQLVQQRIVDGPVLIWEQEGVTYRLESGLTLEEAVRIAESLE